MTQAAYSITFQDDVYPDFSWLEDDCYDPSSPEYSPTWRNVGDMEAGRAPIDPEWYRDPDNHVCLEMVVRDENGEVIDSLGRIDFLEDSDEYRYGTFHRISELPEGYLRDLARDAGLPE